MMGDTPDLLSPIDEERLEDVKIILVFIPPPGGNYFQQGTLFLQLPQESGPRLRTPGCLDDRVTLQDLSYL